MAIKYKVVKQLEVGSDGEEHPKYYARVCDRERYSFRKLCKDISQMSTISEADAVGAMWAFVKLIPEKLKDGYSVDMDELGIFSLHARSESRESEKDINPSVIKEVKIHFRPSNHMKKAVKGAKFTKA